MERQCLTLKLKHQLPWVHLDQRQTSVFLLIFPPVPLIYYQVYYYCLERFCCCLNFGSTVFLIYCNQGNTCFGDVCVLLRIGFWHQLRYSCLFFCHFHHPTRCAKSEQISEILLQIYSAGRSQRSELSPVILPTKSDKVGFSFIFRIFLERKLLGKLVVWNFSVFLKLLYESLSHSLKSHSFGTFVTKSPNGTKFNKE